MTPRTELHGREQVLRPRDLLLRVRLGRVLPLRAQVQVETLREFIVNGYLLASKLNVKPGDKVLDVVRVAARWREIKCSPQRGR